MWVGSQEGAERMLEPRDPQRTGVIRCFHAGRISSAFERPISTAQCASPLRRADEACRDVRRSGIAAVAKKVWIGPVGHVLRV